MMSASVLEMVAPVANMLEAALGLRGQADDAPKTIAVMPVRREGRTSR